MAKRKTRRRAVSRSTSRRSSPSGAEKWWWGLLVLVLKVAGLAFLVQGFILQLATGILYFGALHYAIGTLLYMIGWHVHKAKCDMCK